ncbi:hypothetical protein VCR4J5_1240013 [Vibrio crassostreae]|uniref:Uncharacterized protein n=1 Tax=Vibrio crassostreae TaxID=246167 RepID=A0ABM9QLL2_9VIBR|nr:hypothetical protein VCR4J5_1240013 [Vibrio crassostreae]CDT42046.1 hypothetical protein VCR19J5_280075 [Vibrio crassostreae]
MYWTRPEGASVAFLLRFLLRIKEVIKALVKIKHRLLEGD